MGRGRAACYSAGMLILHSELRDPDGLAFSPDGLALLATGGNRVQVWPRWLDQPPRRAKTVQATLERFAFGPDAARVYLYVSGNSHTRVLNVRTGKENETALPSGGPSWFHFTPEGGFFLVSHDRGKFTRYDIGPVSARARKAWSSERRFPPPAADALIRSRNRTDAGPATEGDPTALGSHYRFGAIGGAAGVFVALEYRYGGHEPLDGLTVRSASTGALLYHTEVTDADGRMLLAAAGLTLAVHPSGAYFAFPQKNRVRLWPLADGVKVPVPPELSAKCRAVAFHPSGALLAAVGDGATVTLYDTATWEVSRTLAWEIGPLRAVCFSPDGTRAATIGAPAGTGRGKKPGGRVVVWDVDV